MRTLLLWHLAYRHLRAGFGRVVLSTVAVALGVALVLAVQMMNQSVLRAFVEAADGVAGRAELTITAGEGSSFSEDIVKQVVDAPGVKAAAPLVTSLAFPADDSGEMVSVYGVDLINEVAIRMYNLGNGSTDVVDDLVEFLSQPDSIVLGREFAERRNLHPGDKFDLVTPAGIRRFTLRGILQPEGLAKALGGRLAVMDLYAAERIFIADRRINQVDVLVSTDSTIAEVAAALTKRLPAELQINEPTVRKDVIRQTLVGFHSMLTAFSLLVVLAGFVISYSRLGAVFEGRTWEIGLLRAVGLRRSVVFMELVKESVIVGALGTGIGIPLGILIGRSALPFVATATSLNFILPTIVATPTVTNSAVVFAMAVGFVACFLAAVAPAVRLARKQPVAALTMRGREMPGVEAGMRWRIALGALMAVGVLVVWQSISGMTAVGNITTGAVALAAWSLAGPTVRRGSVIVTPLWESVFGRVGWFAGEYLGQHARGASLSVATLGLGLGVVLMFGMLGWSLERTVLAQLAGRFRADFVVMSPLVSEGWMAAPVTDHVVDEIKALPGVAVVAGQQLRDVPFDGDRVSLFSHDGVCFRDQHVCNWPLAPGALTGALDAVARGDGALLSASVARRHHISPGDHIELGSPTGRQRFVVAAIPKEEPANAIIIARERYRAAWVDGHVRWTHVRVEPSADRHAVERAIRRQVGERYRLDVRSTSAFVDYLGSQVRRAFTLLYLMEGIIFVLILIGVGDTLATAVLERTREFGMMRAVGLRRSHLFAMVVLEGMALGGLGLALAMVTGLGLGLFWVEIQFPAILGWNLDLHFPASFAVTAAVLTLVLCLVASLIPAMRAALLPVPAALREE